MVGLGFFACSPTEKCKIQFNIQNNIHGSYTVSIITCNDTPGLKSLTAFSKNVILFDGTYISTFSSENKLCNLFIFQTAITKYDDLKLKIDNIDKVILYTEYDSLVYDNSAFCITNYEIY